MRCPAWVLTSASLAAALALSALAASPACAAWPSAHVLDLGYDGASQGDVDGMIVPGEAPGDFYALWASFGAAHVEWYLAHVGTAGNAIWSMSQARLYGDYSLANDVGPVFAPRGDGGFLNAWWDSYPVGAHSVLAGVGDATGAQAPASPPFGVPIATYASGSTNMVAACRAASGAFVGWVNPGLRVQRLNADGSEAAGWPASGWRVKLPAGVSTLGSLALAPDGAGGVLIVFQGATDFLVRATRVTWDTTFAAGWSGDGLTLSSHDDPVSPWTPSQIVRSDATHFFVIWNDDSPRIVVQRFALDGTLDPAWPIAGVTVAATVASSGLTLRGVEDGAGGVTITWEDNGRFLARHVRADGTFPAAYASGAVTVFTGSKLYGAAARGLDDGLAVLWFDGSTGIRGRWLDGNGQSPGCAPGDTCSVLLSSTADMIAANRYCEGVFGARTDGAGGAYYAWSAATGQYINEHLVSHVDYLDQPPLGVPQPAPGKLGMTLRVAPNPSHGTITATLTLPEAGSAKLEVFDVAGRRVAERELWGPGARVETLRLAGPRRAGLPARYLARLVQGSIQRVVSGVVVE